jgi:lambda family phage portal protein
MNFKSIIQDIRSWGSGARVTSDQPAALAPDALAHRGAGFGEKTISTWDPRSLSPDASILPEMRTMSARSGDLTRNNGYAAGVMRTQADNIVGPRGIMLSAQPDWRALGKSQEWAIEQAALYESYYRSWAEDARECDAAGLLDMADQTTVAFKGCFVAGDSFALPLYRPEPNRKWALRIQGIPADRVKNPMGQSDSTTLRGGIVVDEYGAERVFHIAKSSPGDVGMLSNYLQQYETVSVPAETSWGRRRVIHLIQRQGYGQHRAVGALSAVIAQFKQLDSRFDYEMKAQLMKTLIAFFIETPQDNILDAFSDPLVATEMLNARAAPPTFKSGGNIMRLNVGESIKTISANPEGAQFEPFVLAFIRELCAATNLPYELFTKDFSKSSYVGIRAGLAEAHRFFTSEREWLSTGWNQPIYELFMEELANKGLIDAPNFYQNIHAYCRAEWIGAGQGFTDRMKEESAATLAIKSRLSTYKAELGLRGKDWRAVFDQVATEEAYARDVAKISLESDPAVVAALAAAAMPDPAPANDAPPPAPPAPSKPKSD